MNILSLTATLTEISGFALHGNRYRLKDDWATNCRQKRSRDSAK